MHCVTILIVRKETRCCHIGYSYQLTARVLLYAPSHRQDNTYHSLCYTSRGALAGTRNSSMGPAHVKKKTQTECISLRNSEPLGHTRSFYYRKEEMFYLMMHSTHFIYGYMASDIWQRTIQIAREETPAATTWATPSN